MSSNWKQHRLASPAPQPATNPRPAGRASLLSLATNRLSSGWIVLLYALAILTATHWPAHFHCETQVGGIAIDHIVHGLMYLPLACLLVGFLGRRAADSPWRRYRYAITMAILIPAGGLDELTQPWVGRTASWADWFGDATGIAVGVGIALVWRAATSGRGVQADSHL